MTSAAAQPADDEPFEDDRTSVRTGLTATFLTALAREVGEANLTPAALARAVTQVLPIDGAGLSTMVSVLRLPLGASSEVARRAEELQSTLGEGPCLDAAEKQSTVCAGPDELKARWPLYADELTAKTPFRAVVAVPLHAAGQGVFAALDVYSTDPHLPDRIDAHALEALASTVAALLVVCVAEIHDIDAPETGPDWYRVAAGRRHDVWLAIGMVMASRAVRTRDALALLRGQAYAASCSLDDLAADLVQGRRRLTDLTDPTD